MTVAFTLLTYGCVFVVSCSSGQAHRVLADLCSFSLCKLSQTGHSGTPQQQVGTGQMNLRSTAKQQNRFQHQDKVEALPFILNLVLPYTKTGNQAGQVHVAGSKHVQLLQARDGSCLHKRVGVVLHDGTAHQAR